MAEENGETDSESGLKKIAHISDIHICARETNLANLFYNFLLFAGSPLLLRPAFQFIQGGREGLETLFYQLEALSRGGRKRWKHRKAIFQQLNIAREPEKKKRT